ncbi:hypothetical protein [Streptomyces sp. H27-C3]|uniref:hypothetical protein n=1 Tax=Streptomyces sp. H27-C3 TaxID=3046305 RepID=UPI0024BA0480|nr:hypothetical protein [Streptomyces sp. H27-C3]MDJ0460633.1 hypothetical protein [Streptomyces sp. H27-C3]
MAGRAARPRSDDSRCRTCRAPILTQLVGHRAALTVTADLTPLTAEQQAAIREPNRLIWCLNTPKFGPPRLAWTGTWHPTDCPHPHVTEHRCNRQPTTLF